MRSLDKLILLTLLSSLTAAACQTNAPAASSIIETPHAKFDNAKFNKSDNFIDSDADGFPDAVEFRTFNDRENFRRWFTAIAAAQYDEISPAWQPEQQDCAGLVRFAWRESLRRHDRLWQTRIPNVEAVAPDVSGYTLNRHPLGEAIFRTADGAFNERDLSAKKFDSFADARTLKNHNCEFVTRDRHAALAGDLIFFHQPFSQRYPYHVMIFLGHSQDKENDWVVYHTGASTEDKGSVRKLRLATLDQHPDARWRPVASNRNFLGFYRLKILQ